MIPKRHFSSVQYLTIMIGKKIITDCGIVAIIAPKRSIYRYTFSHSSENLF